ncbi:MAG: hypothetical protein PVS3B3_15340 [Ktedonobacteraceae bacterium]
MISSSVLKRISTLMQNICNVGIQSSLERAFLLLNVQAAIHGDEVNGVEVLRRLVTELVLNSVRDVLTVFL